MHVLLIWGIVSSVGEHAIFHHFFHLLLYFHSNKWLYIQYICQFPQVHPQRMSCISSCVHPAPVILLCLVSADVPMSANTMFGALEFEIRLGTVSYFHWPFGCTSFPMPIIYVICCHICHIKTPEWFIFHGASYPMFTSHYHVSYWIAKLW